MRPAGDEAQPGPDPSGDLAAPRRIGIGGPDNDPAGWKIQVSLPGHGPAEGHCRTMVEEARGAQRGGPMRIVVTSVLVDDQDKALRFYTDVLGFVKKTEVPLGAHRWLTVVSPDDPDGVELVLEPDDYRLAKQFKQALVEDGIPFTSFDVKDV